MAALWLPQQPAVSSELPPAPHCPLQRHSRAVVLDLGNNSMYGASQQEQEYPISSASSRKAGHRAAALMTGKGHHRNRTALPVWGWCHCHDCTLLASSHSLPASWQAQGSHDVIFSKRRRRACLLSFGVGSREGEELLGRTGDLISSQQSCPCALLAGTPLPALAHNLYHHIKEPSTFKRRPKSSSQQA